MSREEEYRALFFEETREHLEKIEGCLLELSRNAERSDIINDLFRSVHTIKGSSAAMGFVKTSELVHKMEDIIQSIRDGKSALTSEKTELFLKVYDHLSQFVEVTSAGGSEDELDTSALLEELQALKTGKKITAAINNDKEISPEGCMSIGSNEFTGIRAAADSGKVILGVFIKTSEDSAFKTVRSWMALEELQKHAVIMASNPQNSRIDAIMAGEADTSIETVSAIVVSEIGKSELEGILVAELSEVSLLFVEELKLEGNKLSGDYLDYDEHKKTYTFDERSIIFSRLNLNQGSEPEDEKMHLEQTGLDDIVKTSKDMELILVEMCPNLQECEEKCSQIPMLINGFGNISETASAIEKRFIDKIAKESAELLNMIREGKIIPHDTRIQLIANSLTFIKKAVRCYKSNAELPQDLEAEIRAHLDIINADSVKYIEKALFPKVKGEPCNNKKLGELLVEQGAISEHTKNDIVEIQKSAYPNLKMGQLLVKEEIVGASDVRKAINNQEVSRNQPAGNNFVRIPEQKVGNLFDLLGELIIMQSQQREDFQAVLNGVGDSNRISNNMARMERVTKDIQSIAMTLRMVSIKQTFQKILRIGMHTAKEVNKDINFDVLGDETEVDRSIVEKLNDPLMHLIRNAVSHGIEDDPEERMAQGKSPQGKIKIEASSGKGAVLIEVCDDGKGMDPQKILKKALEKGLASPDREYTEKEIINFIFLPGFSTQEQINNISGRGVGMNVVEEEIKKVGGKVDIKTEKGKGTSFILKIPINMATINGIVVDINRQRYVLPTMSIKRIFKPEAEDWVTIRGSVNMVKNRGELIKLIPIDQMLGQNFDFSDHVILVIEYEGAIRALPVKDVLGKQEIVIKPLDSTFGHLDFLSGSTIMGDGTAALIFDVESFFTNSK